jgi:2-keto-3-deoxy-6-phosphogluconate aldolase
MCTDTFSPWTEAGWRAEETMSLGIRKKDECPPVPTGEVNLETATDYIRAGAAVHGVGGELILKEALICRGSEG